MTKPLPKRIILCADDYGFNPHISDAIITLATLGRLSATSCITNSPQWHQLAPTLQSVKNHLQIGLHFNLTEGVAKFGSIHKLLLLSHLRMLKPQKILAAFQSQYEAFVDAMGFKPQHIDGHQHIHHLPIVREVLLQQYQNGYIPADCYFRNVAIADHSPPQNIKQLIIESSGARRFQQLLRHYHIPHNRCFSGMYHFSSQTSYQQLFRQFLTKIDDNGLIMCHPGNSPDPKNDAIAPSRYQEYQYFISEQFIKDCHHAHVSIAKLNARIDKSSDHL